MIYTAKSIAFNNYEPVGELLIEAYKTNSGELLTTGRYYIREDQIDTLFTQIKSYDYLIDINTVREVH